jgi:hypothetical protein
MQPARSRWQGLRRFRAESGERGTVLARDVAIQDSDIAQPTPLSLRAIHVSGKHGFNPAGIRKSELSRNDDLNSPDLTRINDRRLPLISNRNFVEASAEKFLKPSLSVWRHF